MARNIVGAVIGITIALLLMGILLPIGLSDLVAYNGSYTYPNGTIIGYNATMATLVATVVPILAIIGIVLMFISKRSSD